MGLGRSVPSDSEEHSVDNETSPSDEKSVQPNPPKRAGKHINVVDNEILTPDPHHEIVMKFQKLQMDNIIEERNHSERIIREKEKLLKEKEETIRQQANLIKTQNELLGQRKHQRKSVSNAGTVKSQPDAAYKIRAAKPLAKHIPFTKSVTSLENIHSNGQDHRNEGQDNDYETKYYDVEPYPPKRQDKPSQALNATNAPSSKFPSSNPFQRDSSRSSTSVIPYQSNNVRSPNSNGFLSTPTTSVQARRSQSYDYRRNNSNNEELGEYDSKQSTDQLLADLEKQTHYEMQKLDNVQSGDRPLKPVARTQSSFKCAGCRVPRKYKNAPVGVYQKCKNSCDNVGNKLMHRTCKSDDESQNHNPWTSDSQFISDVD